MIINEFHVIRIAVVPRKADSPLIIYADTALTSSFSNKHFKTVARRKSHILQDTSVMQHSQLSKRHSSNVRRKSETGSR